MTSDFLRIFKERGYFYQATNLDGLDKFLLNDNKATFYTGFDCTANSLHIGNLVQLMVLRLIVRSGFNVIIIFGDGTTKIGDPSGRDKSRDILSDEKIKENIEGIKYSVSKFIDLGSNQVKICYNSEWLCKLNYIDFLRDIGKLFSVNQMLNYESVRIRLEREQHLSFLEFNYMILQAYDFVELQKRYNCRIQFGGSDQWGNIINGIELFRRINELDSNKNYGELYGITTPLITKSDGSKMGKSASGAMWLSEKLLSPYEYYQYWRNVSDGDVIKFLKLFTEVDIKEIEKLEKLEGAEVNEAKKILAFECTKMCHGEDQARKAEETALSTFEHNIISDNLPLVNLSKNDLENGVDILSIFVTSGIAESKGEVKRLIAGGGAKINDSKINNEHYKVTLSDFAGNDKIKISAGKKKHAIIKIN